MASGGPSMYHPWPSMEFAMTTYKVDPLVARPGPSMAMDGMPWSLSTVDKLLLCMFYCACFTEKCISFRSEV